MTWTSSRRRIVTLAAVWLLLLAGAAEAAPSLSDVSQAPPQVRRALFRARELGAAGDFERAAAILADCLGDHPGQDHHLLRYHLAGNLEQADRSAEALPHYRAAVALAPGFAPAWLNLGRLAYEQGDFRLAGEAFATGFDLREAERESGGEGPDDRPADRQPEILHYAAVAYLLAGEPALALPLLDRLTSGAYGSPPLEWYRALVSCSLDLQRTDRARAAVDALLADHPSDPEAWRLASQAALARDDYRAGAVALTVAGYLDPLSRAERLQLGDLYQALSAPARACLHYEAALADSASATDLEKLATAYLAAHDLPAAGRALDRALVAGPSARLFSLLGDLRYMEEDWAAAAGAFARCVELDPDNGRAWLLAGYCTLESDRPDEARPFLRRALDFDDQAANARELLDRVSVAD